MTAFHEILFPLDIALGSAGGPQRRTDVVVLGSGAEERNARWAHSRRRYDAGYGVKTFEALSQVVAFFEERRGRLYGFRWRDRLDHSSAAPGAAVAPTDQVIGAGDGETDRFALVKTYGTLHVPYRPRPAARRGGDRGIPVRRAGALRHRLPRGRSLRLRRRRDPEDPAGGNQTVRSGLRLTAIAKGSLRPSCLVHRIARTIPCAPFRPPSRTSSSRASRRSAAAG